MTGPLYRTGRFCARLHWPVIAAWIVAVILLALGSRAVGEQNSDNLSLPGTGSTKAQDLLKDRLPKQAYGTNPVVLEAAKGKLTDSANSKAVDATVKSLKKEPGVVGAVSPLSDEGKAALSKDKQIGYISVTLSEGAADLTKEDAENIIDATSPASDAGLTVATGGYLGQAVSKADTESSEAVGLTAAVVILLFAFGTATAMLLPIVSAVLGLVASLALIGFLGHVAEVPSVAPTLATMIGLGVGIDYALFIVTRHKLQLNEGMEVRESIARATATAGGAVVFAGGTVVIALVSLLASGIPFVGTMGYSAAVAVDRRGARRGHAPAGTPRRARVAHQLAAREARAHPSGRPRAARVGALGARSRRAPMALARGEHRDPGGPRPPGARPSHGLVGQRRAPGEHDGAPGL